MKKIKSIDNHKIRIKAQEINTPIIEFIFQKLEKLSKKDIPYLPSVPIQKMCLYIYFLITI